MAGRRMMQANIEVAPRLEHLHKHPHKETDFCSYFKPPCQPVEPAAPVQQEAEATATAPIADWMIQRGYVTGHGDTVSGTLPN